MCICDIPRGLVHYNFIPCYGKYSGQHIGIYAPQIEFLKKRQEVELIPSPSVF